MCGFDRRIAINKLKQEKIIWIFYVLAIPLWKNIPKNFQYYFKQKIYKIKKRKPASNII